MRDGQRTLSGFLGNESGSFLLASLIFGDFCDFERCSDCAFDRSGEVELKQELEVEERTHLYN